LQKDQKFHKFALLPAQILVHSVCLFNFFLNTIAFLGYFCQFSDKNKQFQCCAQKAGKSAFTLTI
jgi:hypothetical protein